MSRAWSAGLLGAILVLFLIANRGAYKGYFQDDDMDSLGWTQQLDFTDFAQGLVSPAYPGKNFRPVGHLFYFFMGKVAALRFPAYVAVLQAVHLLNICALWLLLRKIQFPPAAAAIGAAFFAFHMGVADAYWKPLYIFDVLCGFFCLLSILAFTYRRWILSFAFFWLAYKSKELAVMLPAVLACYEYWLGDKKWKRLLPFFLVSASFGLQGLLLSPHQSSDYSLRFGPASLGTTVRFYSSRIFLLPYAGLGLLLLPLLIKDRRLYFGLAAMALLMVPMLLLPGRLFGAYLYSPMAGLGIAMAALANRKYVAPAAVCLVLWLAWNYVQLRRYRGPTLEAAAENRVYVSALHQVARSTQNIHTYVFDGLPRTMLRWGLIGTLRYLSGGKEVQVYSIDDLDLGKLVGNDALALLAWEPRHRVLTTIFREPDSYGSSFVSMDRWTPFWQLQEGWYPPEGSFRWIAPSAKAVLYRPQSAKEFQLTVNIGDFIQQIGRTRVQVLLDGRPLGECEFTRQGWQTVKWELPAGRTGSVKVEFRVSPEYRAPPDVRSLGVPIASFGFLPRQGS